jgi:hypothetical protein
VIGSSTLAEVLSSKGNIADVAGYALRAGYAIVLDQPQSKLPVCILGDAARRRADAAAREQALVDNAAWQTETDPVAKALLPRHARPDRVRHPCGARHAITGAEQAGNVRALVARLEKRHGVLNIGLEPGAGLGRLIVVDVDTPEEVTSFERWCEDRGLDVPPMTVRSPGKKLNGEWAHRDGGHYWFTVPEDMAGRLPTGPDGGVLKLAGFSVVWANRQVLIPPSTRVEGAYAYTGAPIRDCPEALLTAIEAHAAERATHAVQRLQARSGNGHADIDAWDARTSWGELLGLDDWTDTGKVDQCGCPIWTAPGDHASPKSATAHDAGCARYDTSDGWGPLHIWTDSPPEALAGVRTLTKLDYLARMTGRTRAETAAELGIGSEGLAFDMDVEFGDRALPALPERAPVDDFGDPASVTDDTTDLRDDTGMTVPDDHEFGLTVQRLSDMRHRGERPPDLVEGWLGDSGISRIIGKSNEGKTFVAVDLAACIATGTPWNGRAVQQGPVLYVNFEDHEGLQDRFLAWDEAHDGELGRHENNLVLIDPINDVFISATTPEAKDRRARFSKMVVASGARMVVFDTQSMATVGADENDATDMMEKVVKWLKIAAARVPHCQFVLIHHRGHTGEHGRGSTAVYAALDTEITVSRADRDKPDIVIGVTKQRSMAFASEITVMLTVVTVPGVKRPQAVIVHGDPFADATPIGEPDVRLRDVPTHHGLWVYWGSLIRDTLDGPVEGWTASKAESLIVGKMWRGRLVTVVAKRRAWTDLRDHGWIEPITAGAGKFALTDDGRDELEDKLAETP